MTGMSGYNYYRLGYLLIINVLFLQAVFATSQRVFPTEYAYRGGSVTRSEKADANCMNYPPIPTGIAGVHSQHHIHCNGAQLRLNDSEVGLLQQQYEPSYYYEWSAGTETRQMLFIFPTRVNLTNITLHYYSSYSRGLPRLRFYAVPDDFDVWDVASGSDLVHRDAVQPGVNPTGPTKVSIKFNFTTMKVLMVKAASTFKFALSEVEFKSCFSGKLGLYNHNYDDIILSTETTTRAYGVTHTAGYEESTTTSTTAGDTTMVSKKDTVTTSLTIKQGEEYITTWCPNNSTSLCGTTATVRESISLTLAAVLAVLFLSSLTINITQWWIYKKRQTSVKTAAYEMEGNPCYEAAKVNQSGTATGDTNVHVYDVVQGQRSH